MQNVVASGDFCGSFYSSVGISEYTVSEVG